MAGPAVYSRDAVAALLAAHLLLREALQELERHAERRERGPSRLAVVVGGGSCDRPHLRGGGALLLGAQHFGRSAVCEGIVALGAAPAVPNVAQLLALLDERILLLQRLGLGALQHERLSGQLVVRARCGGSKLPCGLFSAASASHLLSEDRKLFFALKLNGARQDLRPDSLFLRVRVSHCRRCDAK